MPVSSAGALTFTWDGQLDDKWASLSGTVPNATTNWSPDIGNAKPIPDSDDTVLFSGASPFTKVDLVSSRSVQSIQFAGGVDYTLTNSVAKLLTGNIQVTGSGAHTINSDIELGASGIWDIASSAALSMNGAVSDISGVQTLTKAGGGELLLKGINGHAGTIVTGGTLRVGADDHLGAPSAGLELGNGTMLRVNQTFIAGAGRTLTLTSGIALIDTTSEGLTWTGPVAGAGGLEVFGQKDLVFSGSTSNTYAGPTVVTSGRLVLNKTAGTHALGGLVLVDGGKLQLLNDHQIADNADVTVNSGTFQLGAFDETIGNLSVNGSGLVEAAPGSTLTLNGDGSILGGGQFRVATLEMANNRTFQASGTVVDFTINGTGHSIDNNSVFILSSGAQFIGDFIDVGAGSDGLLLVNGSTVQTTTPSVWGAIGGNAQVTFEGSTANLGAVVMSSDSTSGTASVLEVRSGSTFNVSDLLVGTGGAQARISLRDPGSNITQQGAATLTIGAASGGSATVSLAGDTAFTTGTGLTTVNATGIVSMTQLGGFTTPATLNVLGDLDLNGGEINQGAGGQFNFAGNTLTARNGAFMSLINNHTIADNQTYAFNSGSRFLVLFALQVGALSDGELIIDGNNSRLGADNVVIVGSGGATGTLTFRNNSTSSLQSLIIADSAQGTSGSVFVQNGARVGVDSSINIASFGPAGGSGVLEIAGTGARVTQTGNSSILVGHGSSGTAELNVLDFGQLQTGTGSLQINPTGTLKIDQALVTANGRLQFNGGRLHVVLRSAAFPAITANSDVLIQSGSTLKLELDPGLTVSEGDSFTLIDSPNLIFLSTFDQFEGRIIGDGLFFEQSVIVDGPAASLVATVMLATPGDTDYDGDVDDADLGTSFANYTGAVGAVGKTFEEGDTDGDGDVDDADLGTSFANYTGALAPSSAGVVPEPGAALLLLAGAAGLGRRCRDTRP